MPAPRKPKKVFVQFAVALVIAAVLGLGALIFGVSIITGVKNNAELARQEAEKLKAEVKAELERIKAQQQQAPQNQPAAKVLYKIVQAAVDIQPGQPITKDMLILVETTQSPAPGTLTMLSEAVGKMVKTAVIQGETLQQIKMLDAAGLAKVKPGMRAMAIQVSNIGTVNNSLTAGSRVDVLTTVTKDDKTITKTLLQNVEVLASSNDPALASRSSNGDSAVTIAVTPKQAELLTLANQLGKFQLTLRHYQDNQSTPLTGADLNTLMVGAGTSRPSLPQPPEPKLADGFQNVNLSPNANLRSARMPASRKFSMQIYRGAGTETVEFER